MSRQKGKRGELELAHKLAELFGEARRGRQYSGIEGRDVVVETLPGVHWECKRVERFKLYPALDQAIEDAGDEIPVVAHRRNAREWVVCIRLSDLLRFLRAARTFLD